VKQSANGVSTCREIIVTPEGKIKLHDGIKVLALFRD